MHIQKMQSTELYIFLSWQQNKMSAFSSLQLLWRVIKVLFEIFFVIK